MRYPCPTCPWRPSTPKGDDRLPRPAQHSTRPLSPSYALNLHRESLTMPTLLAFKTRLSSLRDLLLSHGLWPLTAARRQQQLLADKEKVQALWRTTRWYL